MTPVARTKPGETCAVSDAFQLPSNALFVGVTCFSLTSVRCRHSLYMVDHQHSKLDLHVIQLQPKLALKRISHTA